MHFGVHFGVHFLSTIALLVCVYKRQTSETMTDVDRVGIADAIIRGLSQRKDLQHRLGNHSDCADSLMHTIAEQRWYERLNDIEPSAGTVKKRLMVELSRAAGRAMSVGP